MNNKQFFYVVISSTYQGGQDAFKISREYERLLRGELVALELKSEGE